MSDWKESAVKRRDFRSVKDKPEAPGAIRSKKTKKPFEVWSRFKPEYWQECFADKELWWRIRLWSRSKEEEKSNNWSVFGRYSTLKGAEQAKLSAEKDRYHGEHREYRLWIVKPAGDKT